MNLGYTGKPYDAAAGAYNYGYRDYKAELGRFTTEDPVRDGANWFAYVDNDPVNYIDLWGLEAYVYTWEQDGKTYVSIQIPITYVGEGAKPDVIAKFNKGIEEQWSGEIGKYTVETVVTNDTTLELMNTVNVPTGNERADMITWPSERSGWTAAHEAGHLLGLIDRYDKVTEIAYDTWDGNIMASFNGAVEERNIDAVLGNRGPDNTIRAGTWDKADEPVGTGGSPSKKNH
jgi:RHS repeat-associated protein